MLSLFLSSWFWKNGLTTFAMFHHHHDVDGTTTFGDSCASSSHSCLLFCFWRSFWDRSRTLSYSLYDRRTRLCSHLNSKRRSNMRSIATLPRPIHWKTSFSNWTATRWRHHHHQVSIVFLLVADCVCRPWACSPSLTSIVTIGKIMWANRCRGTHTMHRTCCLPLRYAVVRPELLAIVKEWMRHSFGDS